MADFSLIILCNGKDHLLNLTLDSLVAQEGNFEVLLMGEYKLFRKPELNLREISGGRGRGDLMNRGASQAESPYVQFLEPGDRYISQHGLAFLQGIAEKKPDVIASRGVGGEETFYWIKKERILEWGGFDKRLLSPLSDFIFRAKANGAHVIDSPRVLVDSPHPAQSSLKETLRVLYRHFGVKHALKWLFVQNRPNFMKKAAHFMKRSFWSEE